MWRIINCKLFLLVVGMYWGDASRSTLGCCIGGMHLLIHYCVVLEGCIS